MSSDRLLFNSVFWKSESQFHLAGNVIPTVISILAAPSSPAEIGMKLYGEDNYVMLLDKDGFPSDGVTIFVCELTDEELDRGLVLAGRSLREVDRYANWYSPCIERDNKWRFFIFVANVEGYSYRSSLILFATSEPQLQRFQTRLSQVFPFQWVISPEDIAQRYFPPNTVYLTTGDGLELVACDDDTKDVDDYLNTFVGWQTWVRILALRGYTEMLSRALAPLSVASLYRVLAASDDHGKTLIHDLARSGAHRALEFIMSALTENAARFLLNLPNQRGESPLFLCRPNEPDTDKWQVCSQLLRSRGAQSVSFSAKPTAAAAPAAPFEKLAAGPTSKLNRGVDFDGYHTGYYLCEKGSKRDGLISCHGEFNWHFFINPIEDRGHSPNAFSLHHCSATPAPSLQPGGVSSTLSAVEGTPINIRNETPVAGRWELHPSVRVHFIDIPLSRITATARANDNEEYQMFQVDIMGALMGHFIAETNIAPLFDFNSAPTEHRSRVEGRDHVRLYSVGVQSPTTLGWAISGPLYFTHRVRGNRVTPTAPTGTLNQTETGSMTGKSETTAPSEVKKPYVPKYPEIRDPVTGQRDTQAEQALFVQLVEKPRKSRELARSALDADDPTILDEEVWSVTLDKWGSTLGALAAEEGKVNILSTFIESGRRLIENGWEWKIGHHAVECASGETMKLLIDKGVLTINEAREVNRNKSTVIDRAASSGHVNVLKVLLDTFPQLLHERSLYGGYSLLHVTYQEKDAEKLESKVKFLNSLGLLAKDCVDDRGLHPEPGWSIDIFWDDSFKTD